MLPFEQRYLENLRKLIDGELTRLHTNLGSGAKINRSDAAATGLAYAETVAEIRGLQTARTFMQDVYNDMSGRTPPKRKED